MIYWQAFCKNCGCFLACIPPRPNAVDAVDLVEEEHIREKGHIVSFGIGLIQGEKWIFVPIREIDESNWEIRLSEQIAPSGSTFWASSVDYSHIDHYIDYYERKHFEEAK